MPELGKRVKPILGNYFLDNRSRIGECAAMTLREFMKSNNLTEADMASKIGASIGAIRKWRYGDRVPRGPHMRRITEVTCGAVTANDFVIHI